MIMRFPLLCVLSICAAFAQDGAAIYRKRCASCHDTPAPRIPPFSALRAMDPGSIMKSLDTGIMKKQAEGLTSAERYALVGYITTPVIQKPTPLPAAAFCGGNTQTTGPGWSGWGANLANTRFQDAASAGFTASDVPKLKLKWAFGLGEGIVARSQPSIADGRVFVGSEKGHVFSLDAGTGCIHWVFEADGSVRTAIVVGKAAYFGDQKANAYAADKNTGKLLWKTRVDDHFAALITGSPLLHEGVLYVPVSSYEEALAASPGYECCVFRGSVVALDAATGKQIWKTYTVPDMSQPTKKGRAGPSGVAVWSAPTFDERLGAIYIATGDNYSDPPTKTSDAVLALDPKTGKILWSRQLASNDAYNMGCDIPGSTACPEANGPDSDFGQPPILVSLPNGRRALVIGQKSGMAHAIDPDRQGEILWQTRVGKGGRLGGIQWGSAADRENMYVAVSDIGLKPIMDANGFRLEPDPNAGGGLFALRLATGEKAWSAKPIPCGERKNCSPAQSAAVTAIPGAVFSGSVDGHLRAYSAANGEIIWDADTAREYETVNGQKARGGSMDGPGPAIAGGMLYVNSGYGQWGGMPGNVLLAFSVGGK